MAEVTPMWKGAIRSLLRTILFAVLPILVAALSSEVWLENFMPTEYAVVLAAVLGALFRALLPDVFGKREDAGIR